jgi:tetratricopeptide (TPR) repeat protein
LKEEAENAFRSALDADPGHANAWANLGSLLWEAGRNKEAASAYRSALQSAPDLAWVWNNLGSLLRTEGLLEEAERAYRSALEFGPELAGAWNNLGVLLAETNRTEEAEHAYRCALGIDPMNSAIWLNLGIHLEDTGRYQGAEEVFRAALSAGIESALIENALAWLLFSQEGDLEEAARLADAARTREPECPETNHTLACILARLGQWEGASRAARIFLIAWRDELAEWPNLRAFFREAVTACYCREAADLLEELGLADRWRPLREALEALAQRSPSYLRRVAPEVRTPAEEILLQLTAGLLGASPAPAAKPAEARPLPVAAKSGRRKTPPDAGRKKAGPRGSRGGGSRKKEAG